MIDFKHAWDIDWDSKGYEALIVSPYNEGDWNITLITKINQLGAQISRGSVRSVKRVIRANEKVINKFIKTMDFYNNKTNLLSGRYKIVIDDLIANDELYVYSELLLEKPMLVPDKVIGFNQIQKFSFASDLDQKDVDLYKSKLIGRIKLLNYED